MHVEPVVNEVRAALVDQSSLASGDPAVDAAVKSLVAALGPALRVAAFELAEQAAAEVNAQMTDRKVEIFMSDGDPTLRVTETAGVAQSPTADEDFDARITLRLPPSLKRLIEDSATVDGDSVNSWVVDALTRRARPAASNRGRRVTESFDL
jgi:hypothetical protein